MKLAYITVQIAHPDFWYKFFYGLPFLILLIALFIYGERKRYDRLTWVVSVMAWLTLFIIGTRLMAIDRAGLSNLFTHGIQTTSGRSILGGSLFAIIVVLFNKRFLKVPTDFVYLLAFITPLAKAIQRIGCFLYGCCYGNETDLFFGVQYSRSLSSAQQVCSHVLHPVQLYEALGLLMVPVFLYAIRKRLRHTENYFYLSLALSLLVRFITEFFRMGESSLWMREVMLGLKWVQWLVLFGMILLLGVVIYREYKVGIGYSSGQLKPAPTSRLTAWIVLLAGLLWCFKPVLQSGEQLVLVFLTGLMALILLVTEFKRMIHSNGSYTTLTFLMLSFVLMNQTVDLQPRYFGDKTKPNPKRHLDLGVVYTQGSFSYNEFLLDSTYYTSGSGGSGGSGGCSNGIYNVYDTFPHKITYVSPKVTGALKLYANNKYSFTFGMSVGKNGYRLEDHKSGNIKNASIAIFSPYMQYDSRRIGLGFGVNVGIWNHIDQSSNKEMKQQFEQSTNPFFYARVGNPRYFYLAGFINDPKEAMFGQSTTRFEFGSQFDNDRLSFATGAGQLGLYFGAKYLFVDPSIVVNTSFYLPGTVNLPGFRDMTSSTYFSLGLAWRMNVLNR